MHQPSSRSLDWLVAAVACLVAAAIALSASAQSQTKAPPVSTPVTPAEPAPAPPPPMKPPTPSPAVDLGSIGAVTTNQPTRVRLHPYDDAPVVSWLRPGISLPVDRHFRRYVRVLTPCEVTGWVRTDRVSLHEPARGVPRSLAEATVVIDAGHGGRQRGAVGPEGLPEKNANLAITSRLPTRLRGARIFLTRDADYTAGVRYRARLASALRAHAFVSVHNNSMPDGPSAYPGTETWHQSRSPAAKQLAALVWTDLVRALEPFELNWVSDRKESGTRVRFNQHGHDFYALLRGSSVPTVIVEAMFITNAPEEQLLLSAQGLDAVADAIAAGIKKFVTTAGPEIAQPQPIYPVNSSGLPPGCVDPG